MPLSPETERFIYQHRNDDVRALALHTAGSTEVDIKAALEQIAGWQKARAKLPAWAQKEGIIYPPALSMEQCSSQQTALYKAGLAARLTRTDDGTKPTRLVDLTGGFGVDFSFMASTFQEAVYVERQERLCRIAEHNLGVLGLANATVKCAKAEEYAAALKKADMIFLDPARRDVNGKRTYAIADCTPDVLAMKDTLLAKTPAVMVKLSPMLDWRKAVSDFNGAVSEVHILAVGGECKELLLVIGRNVNTSVRMFCVNDGDILEYDTAEDRTCAGWDTTAEETYRFISEPNAAVMKAGCYGLVERRFGVSRIGLNSNLFTSPAPPSHFPGRVFAVDGVSTMNRRGLKALLSGLTQANITVRNFPLSVAELRKRLRLKDGGDCYIFGTTDRQGRHVIVKAHKPHGNR